MPLVRIALSAVIAFGLDRLSKLLIVQWLDLRSVHVIPVWPPYLNLVMAWNTGINFGLLGGHSSRWALVAVSIAFCIGITAWARHVRGWLLPLTIGAVVGGALSNALDRVLYGAVADYLNMSCCGIANPYSFNVADIFVVCGMVLLAITIERTSAGRPRDRNRR